MANANSSTLERDKSNNQNLSTLSAREERAIYRAMCILETYMKQATGEAFNSPSEVRKYLSLKLAREESEQFVVMFLDSQHRLIEAETMFYGTLTQTSVYPREVVKRALYHNAASVLLAHNHPSGVAAPSMADRILTDVLKQSLSLVDIRILDHFIVAGNEVLSFAEYGLLDCKPGLESKMEKQEHRKALARKLCRPRIQTKAMMARARTGNKAIAAHV